MNIRQEITKKVLNTNEDENIDQKGMKNVSLRLSYEDFSKLKVLSSRLKVTPTALARDIFLSGLSEAVGGYFDAFLDDSLNGDHEIIVSEFAEDVQELTIDLLSGE